MRKSRLPMPSQEREEALSRAAVELTPGATPQAFLDQACVGDPALHQRLEALFAAHGRPNAVLPSQVETVFFRSEPSAHPARSTLQAELPDDADDAVGQHLGRCKLLEKVGEGGCGVVYVAEQTEPVRRRVALKVIKLDMDTKQVVARFEAERQALAMMEQPNIAKVLDAGTTDLPSSSSGPLEHPIYQYRHPAGTLASRGPTRLWVDRLGHITGRRHAGFKLGV
jgi:hypothetical protein